MNEKKTVTVAGVPVTVTVVGRELAVQGRPVRPAPTKHTDLEDRFYARQGPGLHPRQRGRAREQNAEPRRKLDDMRVERDEYKQAADALARALNILTIENDELRRMAARTGDLRRPRPLSPLHAHGDDVAVREIPLAAGRTGWTLICGLNEARADEQGTRPQPAPAAPSVPRRVSPPRSTAMTVLESRGYQAPANGSRQPIISMMAVGVVTVPLAEPSDEDGAPRSGFMRYPTAPSTISDKSPAPESDVTLPGGIAKVSLGVMLGYGR